MRYFYLLLCSIISCSLSSQTPPFINYQGVARNSAGDPVVKKTIGLKFDIRQGSASGTVVFSESQSVFTGNLGVFSVRIGTTTTKGVSAVNWNAGTFFLQVSIDTSDTQNYTVLGVQQIISVPYAMQAASVPASYTNNVLSVGTQTMAINDQSLSMSAPNTLSITNGNTVEIAPTLSLSNNILTVGPATNTISLPLTASTSVTGGGAAAVTSTGSVYQVSVAPATITQSTNVTVSGNYPDFTVSATPSLSLLGPNTLSISGGNTVGLAPTLALSGNSLSVGSPTNYITVPTPTITGTGAASINPPVGLNYVIHVPLTTLTPTGGGISITNAGVNQFTLSVLAPTLSNGSNVNVTGAHPNFVINATPTLSLLSANTLSISYGNSVPIAPTLSFNNNVLTVGPATNTVTVPSGNTYTVSGPGLQLNGTAPNYTISQTIPVLGVLGQSIALTQGTASNAVTLPSPTLGLNNNTLSVGTNSIALDTYTVSGPGLSITPGPNHVITSTPVNPTITQSGIAVVTPTTGTSFNVNVPAPVLSVTGQSIAISQGTANSSVAVPSPTLGLTNNTLSVGQNSIALDTYTVSGPGLSITPGPNHVITSTPVNPTITQSGIAVVTPTTGTSFNVNVPAPVLSVTGQSIAISQGTANSSVAVPSPTLGLTNNTLSVGQNSIALETYTVAGPGISISSGPNHTITTSLVSPTFVAVGAVSLSPSSGSTITVTVPETSVTATTGIATISSAGTNSYNVNVPAPSLNVTGNVVTLTQGTVTTTGNLPAPAYNQSNGILTTGTATTNITPTLQIVGNVLTVGPAGNAVPLPASSSTIQQAGIAVVSPSTGNNFTVTVPPPVYNPATGALTQGTATQNITQAITFTNNVLTSGPSSNSVSIPNANITGLGAAVVASTTNNYTIFVPIPNYTPATGILGAGPNTLNITQNVTFTNNILTVGPTFNTVDISGVSPWTQTAGAVALTNPTNNVGIGTNAPTENLQIESSSAHASVSIISSSPHLASLLFGTPGSHGQGRVVYDNSSNNMNIFTNNTSRVNIDANGNVGLKTTGALTNDFSIFNTAAPTIRMFNSSTLTNGFIIGQNNFGVSLLNYDNTPMQLATNGAARITIAGGGNVGIGTTGPTENLQVENSSASAAVSIIAPATLQSSLLFGTSTLHTLGKISYDNSSNTMNIFTNNSQRVQIDASGNVGFKAAANTAYDLNVFNPGTNTAIRLFNSATSSFGMVIGANSAGVNFLNYETTPMHFGTSSINRLSITAAGNIGIGTTVPAELLQVESAGNTALSVVSTTASTLYFGNSGNHFRGAVRYDNTDNSMNLWTNNTANRLVINNSGNVGIGTPSPGINAGAAKYLSVSSATAYSNNMASFELEGAFMGTSTPFARMDFNSWGPAATTSTNVARISGYNGGTVGMGVLGFSTRNGTTLIERMRIDETGKVSIGTITQPATLQVVDGSQGAGKVLTSDAQGNASWMNVLPAGMVMAYGGTVIPAGWLLCDGTSYVRTAFPDLFTAIGTAWGSASGTTFNVPDMRGMFLRGVNGTATGADPDAITRTAVKTNGNMGNNVGSAQQDQYETHNHTSGVQMQSLAGLGLTSVAVAGGSAISTGFSGGQETRPKNVYVYYIIKY